MVYLLLEDVRNEGNEIVNVRESIGVSDVRLIFRLKEKKGKVKYAIILRGEGDMRTRG